MIETHAISCSRRQNSSVMQKEWKQITKCLFLFTNIFKIIVAGINIHDKSISEELIILPNTLISSATYTNFNLNLSINLCDDELSSF